MPAAPEPDANAKVVKRGPLPESEQLVGILAARIARGDWPADTPLPAEKRLAQEYEVARNTVRKAIGQLVEQGLLYVIPRRGTYVA